MTILGILITLLAFTGTISVGQEITLLPRSATVEANLGGIKVFTCQVPRETNNANIEWYSNRDQVVQPKDERMYIESDGKHSLKLYITNIENGDSGLYTCKATINGERRTKAIQLHLYKDITFDNAPKHQTPEIFTNALVACEVSGQPKPTVSWKYQNERITEDNPEHARYSVSAKGLTISNITEEDNGVYTCRAEVLADGRMKHKLITVEVHIPPKVTSGPGDEEGTEEQQFVLECTATGKPKPKWEFYKGDNNNPLTSTERREIDEENGRITFNQLHRDDTGKYRCMAINRVGSDSAEGFLDVVVKPFIFEYKEVKGEEGKSTSLTCITEGNPPPEMTFRKVGREFDYEIGDNDNGRAIVEQVEPKRLTLTISELTPNDTANYTCRAKNSGGQHALNSTITVEYKPRFPANHVRQVYSWAGKVRNMTCDIIAEPAPVIRWLLFNQELRDNETFKIFNMGKRSSLQITVRDEDQIWIYNEYTCRATNNYGSADLGIKLDRATVPDQPKDAKVVEESPTMVRIHIDAPENDGGVEVRGYRVEWQHNSLEFQIDDNILIENLAPSTRFIFRIRAKNEVGVGNSFELTHLTEDIRAPFPLILTCDPKGKYPYEYTLSWERPKTGGLPIEQYKIQYRKVAVSNKKHSNKVENNAVDKPLAKWVSIIKDDDPDKPILAFQLKGLDADQDYQLEVQAKNDIGWSMPNEEFVFSTASGPDEGPVESAKQGMGTAAVIAIVVAVFFIFLIIVDISCYFMNNCGVLQCICVSLCGKRQEPAKEKAMEEGQRQEVRQPIEEARIATDVQATPPMQQLQEEEEEEEEGEAPPPIEPPPEQEEEE